jgi:hypothetical protein
VSKRVKKVTKKYSTKNVSKKSQGSGSKSSSKMNSDLDAKKSGTPDIRFDTPDILPTSAHEKNKDGYLAPPKRPDKSTQGVHRHHSVHPDARYPSKPELELETPQNGQRPSTFVRAGSLDGPQINQAEKSSVDSKKIAFILAESIEVTVEEIEKINGELKLSDESNKSNHQNKNAPQPPPPQNKNCTKTWGRVSHGVAKVVRQ